MKVLHVISDSNIGGAGRYLLTYLRNCNRQEFDVSVALPKGSKLTEEINALNFPVFELDGLAERSVSLGGIWALYRLFLKEKPQLVHTHACLSARIAGRMAGVNKIVYTRHSVFPQKDALTKGVGKKLNGLVGASLTDGVIAVAEAAKQNVTDTGMPPERVQVIYNGVDPLTEDSPEQKREFRSQYGIGPDEAVVAIIARLEEVKGHEYFIDAAKAVKDEGIKARFVIAGTGGRMEALKAYAKERGVEDFVLFTGFLTNVSALENVMDVQVNASFGTEAASLSLLEGMSLGKPAVVSDFGGNPELIQDGVNGFVVPKQNAGALADAIIRLLTNGELMEEMKLRAKRVFSQRFTARMMTEQMELFYNALKRCPPPL